MACVPSEIFWIQCCSKCITVMLIIWVLKLKPWKIVHVLRKSCWSMVVEPWLFSQFLNLLCPLNVEVHVLIESLLHVLLSTEMHYRSSFTLLIIKRFRPLNLLSQARGVSTLDWMSSLTLSVTPRWIFYSLRTGYVTLGCTLGSTDAVVQLKGIVQLCKLHPLY